MSQNQLKAALQAAIDDSIGFLETETVEQRKLALQAYLRQPYGNEVEGKSQIVTGEVAEAIDGALPALIRIFTGSDQIVVADPVGPGDEAGAKQATDYLNHIFLKDNPGITILHDWFFDALLQKNGIVKAVWEDKEDVSKETYEGLSDDELAMLLQDESIEVVEQDTVTNPILDPMGMPVFDEMGVPATYGIHDVTIKKTEKSGKVVIANVPPEEFLIAKAGKTVKNTPFCAHRRMITRSDLIAMGFDEEVVNGLPTGDALAEQSTARALGIPQGANNNYTMSCKYSATKMWGKGVLANNKLLGAVGSAPTEDAFYTITGYAPNVGSGEIDCEVFITYIAVWTELHDIAGS